jgi:hypothetical protein
MVKLLFLAVFGLFSSATFIGGAAIAEVRCSTDLLDRTICKDHLGNRTVGTPDQLGGVIIKDDNGNRTRCFKDPMGTLICR